MLSSSGKHTSKITKYTPKQKNETSGQVSRPNTHHMAICRRRRRRFRWQRLFGDSSIHSLPEKTTSKESYSIDVLATIHRIEWESENPCKKYLDIRQKRKQNMNNFGSDFMSSFLTHFIHMRIKCIPLNIHNCLSVFIWMRRDSEFLTI